MQQSKMLWLVSLSCSYHFVVVTWSTKEGESGAVKYWEIIADRLSAGRLELGLCLNDQFRWSTNLCCRCAPRRQKAFSLCARTKSSARLLNLKESAANHCAFQMSNNSAQFSPCSLLPALLLASALNPRKRISQTHLSSRDHSTARPCQRNPALFSPEEFR